MSAEHAGSGALRLLRDAFTEVSRRESRVALRDHPGREVRDEVQALQGNDAGRHQVTGGEESVLQECRHGSLACRDGREVIHLDAEDDIKEQKYVEPDEV